MADKKERKLRNYGASLGPPRKKVPSYQSVCWAPGTMASMVQNQGASRAHKGCPKVDRIALRGREILREGMSGTCVGKNTLARSIPESTRDETAFPSTPALGLRDLVSLFRDQGAPQAW